MTAPAPALAAADLDPSAETHPVMTADGVRLRLVAWPRAGARATVLILPGRTEYADKYAPVAAELARAGFAAAAIDWRGQGLADRLLPDPLKGHVGRFDDYQSDLDACLRALESRAAHDLPARRVMLAHSMGGAIGLRALIRGAGGFECAVFSAPMWGLRLAGGAAAVALIAVSARLGLATRYCPPPATGPRVYVSAALPETNVLTRDPAALAGMKSDLEADPRLALAGPTIGWLAAALAEMRALRRTPSPDVPALALLGTAEAVVDPEAILSRMARWPGGRVLRLEGARHEPLMEDRARRAALCATIAEHYSDHLGRPAAADRGPGHLLHSS
jgi:lysophospholipase